MVENACSDYNERVVREILETGVCPDCDRGSLHACVLLVEEKIWPLAEEAVYACLASAGTHMVVSAAWVRGVETELKAASLLAEVLYREIDELTAELRVANLLNTELAQMLRSEV